MLDVILSNDSLSVFDIVYHPPFSTSDHLCLAWKTWFPPNLCDPSRTTTFNFAKADYDMLHNYLSNIDWVNEFSVCHSLDTESIWTIFKNVLLTAISLYVPLCTPLKSKKHTYPNYITRSLNKIKLYGTNVLLPLVMLPTKYKP